jgi:hypothetical protein
MQRNKIILHYHPALFSRIPSDPLLALAEMGQVSTAISIFQTGRLHNIQYSLDGLFWLDRSRESWLVLC